MSDGKGLGWKEPAIVIGIVGVLVAVLAFGRDLTEVISTRSGP